MCDCVMSDDGMSADGKTIDHILPVSLGGAHSRENVRVVCRFCNLARGARADDLSQLSIGMVAR